MSPEDRARITQKLRRLGLGEPLWFDAAEIGPIKRPRLYWTSFSQSPMDGFELYLGDAEGGYAKVRNKSKERIPALGFLEEGAGKGGNEQRPFPTSVRWIPRSKPPPEPAGIDECDDDALRK